MPGLDGLAAAHRIKDSGRRIGVVIFSSYVYVSYLRELLSDGRLGYAYLLKTATVEQVSQAIRTVAARRCSTSPRRSASVPARLPGSHASRSARTTCSSCWSRERTTRRSVNGSSMQPGTVSMHISNIYSKLELDGTPGMNPRVALVLMYHGLLE